MAGWWRSTDWTAPRSNIAVVSRSDRGGQHRRRGQLSAAELAAAAAKASPSKAPRNTPVCGARLSSAGQLTGETCTHERGWGTNHRGYGSCKLHGGNTPAGRKSAAEQQAREIVAEQRARAGLFGARLVVDPQQVLLEEMHRSAAVVRNIEESMRQWSSADYSDTSLSNTDDMGHEDKSDIRSGAVNNGVNQWGQTVTGLPQLVAVHMTEQRIGYTDTEWAAWIKVLREERKHLVQVAQACINAGVVVDMKRMLEANARFMRKVLEAAMGILGVQLDPDAVAPAMQQAILHVVRDTEGKGKAS